MSEERNWEVTPWTRRDRRGHEDVEIPGAEIFDLDTDLRYRVTLGHGPGGPWLTYLEITATRPGDWLGSQFIYRLPTRALVKAAQQLDPHPDDAPPKAPPKPRIKYDDASLREVAAAYPNRTREDLARVLGVSLSSLDRLLKATRARGFLPPVRPGRPRAQVPGGPPVIPGTEPYPRTRKPRPRKGAP